MVGVVKLELFVQICNLKVYYDFASSILEMFCSSHLLGCYCHPDYLCQLVRFIRQANLS